MYASLNGTVGGPHNDVAVGSWSSPQEFLDQSKDEIIEYSKEFPNGITNFNYKEAYVIETTTDQDQKIAAAFTEIAKEKYDLISNNCAHAVQRSLKEGEVLPMSVNTHFYPTNTGYGFDVTLPTPMYRLPSVAYRYIFNPL